MALIIASIFIGFLIVVSVIVSRLPSHIIRYWICPKCEKPITSTCAQFAMYLLKDLMGFISDILN